MKTKQHFLKYRVEPLYTHIWTNTLTPGRVVVIVVFFPPHCEQNIWENYV